MIQNVSKFENFSQKGGKSMPKLDEIEENLSERDLILKWLFEEKISYIDLSNQYTKYLEEIKNQELTKNSRYSRLLAQCVELADFNKKTNWVRDKAIGTLYQYGDYKTSPMHDMWGEYIKNNKINTNLDSLDIEVYHEEKII